MSDIDHPIKNLLGSGEITNIRLAFSLIESQSLDLEIFILPYRTLFNISAETIISPEMLAELFLGIRLDLSKGNLLSIPDEIIYLKWLNTVRVSQNELKNLPENFSSLKHLRALDLSYNKFRRIPEQLFDFKELKVLNLMGNPIQLISQRISELSNLENLNLRACSINNLGNGIQLADSVRILDLGENNLSDFPISFCNSELQQLDLDDNPLYNLPDEIGNMRSLKILDLSNCRLLKKIPDSFRELSSLEKLILRGCHSIDTEKLSKKIPWIEIYV